jgi:cytoskeletal protein CcmA (bactofilin family)
MSFRGAAPGDFPTPDDDLSGDPFSLVDRHSTFEGTFRSERDLRVEGTAKGAIECRGTVFVAEGATVDATIDAEHVTVAGEVTGEIRCRGRLQLMPSARVRGRIATQTLVINEGAVYEGQLEMSAAEGTLRPRGHGNAPVPISAAAEGRSSTTFIRRLGGPETAWDDAAEEGAGAADEQGERNG